MTGSLKWQPNVERSSELDLAFHNPRNLAIAYSHQSGEGAHAKAVASLEKAVAIKILTQPISWNLTDVPKSKIPVEKRLALLENQNVVVKSDEALGNLINLKNFAGKAEESLKLLRSRVFGIWEGGQAFNTGQAWADAKHCKRTSTI